MGEDEQIIVIKRKGGHAAHHGGAWKVAYADFVTAMMSLFIVLWLMNSSKPVQDAVGGYFRDPKGTAQKRGTNLGGMGDASAAKKEDMAKLKEDLIKSIEKMANFEKLKQQIELTITPEGLRIEMMEDPKGTFFEPGKAQPTPVLGDLLKILAEETGKLPNNISIEGHTDATPYSGGKSYDNWDLSCGRANEARRMMQEEGLEGTQISQVRGFADQRLRLPQRPDDPSNRRISLIVLYLTTGGAPIPLANGFTLSNTLKSPN